MTVTNFGFLEKEFPMLFNIAASAEYYLYADPVASLFKLRQFGEKVTAYICDTHQVDLPTDDTFNNRIRVLESENIYPANIASLVHNIKHRGNIAVHQTKGTVDDAKTILFSAFKFGKWFYETYSDENRDLANLKFTPPKNLDARHALDQLERSSHPWKPSSTRCWRQKRQWGLMDCTRLDNSTIVCGDNR